MFEQKKTGNRKSQKNIINKNKNLIYLPKKYKKLSNKRKIDLLNIYILYIFINIIKIRLLNQKKNKKAKKNFITGIIFSQFFKSCKFLIFS